MMVYIFGAGGHMVGRLADVEEAFLTQNVFDAFTGAFGA